jgi:hypothetical protein
MSNKKDKHFWDETRKPWMDLENERRPIRPQKSARENSRANETTGMLNLLPGSCNALRQIGTTNQQLAGFFQDLVMEKAMKDRVSQIARIDTPDVCYLGFCSHNCLVGTSSTSNFSEHQHPQRNRM